MTNDTYFLEIMAKQKQGEFEREAALRRLRYSGREKRPGLKARIWIRLGDFLIKRGEAIKSRYMPGPCLACSSDFQGGQLHQDAKGC
ncbi:MAG: hypothetical protein MI863_11775 [Desulfobacterales bacterium]|nr:hypothetical protein [Desulfobacterales bacterium]